jgi:hypothetical protein
MYRAKASGGNLQVEYGPSEPLAEVEPRRALRVRDTHPHRVSAELGVVVAR